MEHEKIINDILDAALEFDYAVVNYEKDHSGANRKAFIDTHKRMNILVKEAPSEVRDAFTKSWDKITMIVRGLQSSSYSFSYITTFGTEARTAEAQLIMIKGELGMIMKTLRDILNPPPVIEEEPNVEPVEEESTVIDEPAIIEEVTEPIIDEAKPSEQENPKEEKKNLREENELIIETIIEGLEDEIVATVVKENKAAKKTVANDTCEIVPIQVLPVNDSLAKATKKAQKIKSKPKDTEKYARKSFALAGLILSILSIFIASQIQILPLISLFFSIYGVKSKKGRVMAIIGILLSALVLAIMFLPLTLLALAIILVVILLIISIPVGLIALLFIGILNI